MITSSSLSSSGNLFMMWCHFISHIFLFWAFGLIQRFYYWFDNEIKSQETAENQHQIEQSDLFQRKIRKTQMHVITWKQYRIENKIPFWTTNLMPSKRPFHWSYNANEPCNFQQIQTTNFASIFSHCFILRWTTNMRFFPPANDQFKIVPRLLRQEKKIIDRKSKTISWIDVRTNKKKKRIYERKKNAIFIWVKYVESRKTC